LCSTANGRRNLSHTGIHWLVIIVAPCAGLLNSRLRWYACSGDTVLCNSQHMVEILANPHRTLMGRLAAKGKQVRMQAAISMLGMSVTMAEA